MNHPDYKTTFDQVAELYEEIRPGYPAETIEAIIQLSHLPEAASILEIGLGTGQITEPFAKRGCQILGLEPGINLARVAQRKFQHLANVRIQTETFEDWDVVVRKFDLVLAAQAFHWIAPEVGLRKAATALKDSGFLALVWTLDRSAVTPFYQATTPVFEKYMPDDPERPTPPTSFSDYRQVLEKSTFFETPLEHSVNWQRIYTRDDFIKLLNTHSNNLALAAEARAAFNAEIEAIIDIFGGKVTRLYQTVLLLAKKRVPARPCARAVHA